MNDFRKTQESQHLNGTANPPASVTSHIIVMLNAGLTPNAVAGRLQLPLEFVNAVIERSSSEGKLAFFELKTGNCSSSSGCSPDPDSPVCAGCPIYPASARKARAGLFSHVSQAFPQVTSFLLHAVSKDKKLLKL